MSDAQRRFAAEVVRLKAKAGQLKLWKTMHALEAGVTAVGWELAELLGSQDRRKPGQLGRPRL